ncbi:MAG: hypothetical protein B6D56_00975 [Candidatus Omnitrophica bacterium 4484_70.1]|nr:MAG: hypothetical protein B6D56_00975 [Candidatus Omnitrophica bacterium 4484_70.1]
MIKQGVIFSLLFIFIFFIFSLSTFSWGEYLSYETLMKLGKQAFNEHNYKAALRYFNLAHERELSANEPLFYIELIENLRKKQKEEVETLEKEVERQRPGKIFKFKKKLGRKEKIGEFLDKFALKRERRIRRILDELEKTAKQKKKTEIEKEERVSKMLDKWERKVGEKKKVVAKEKKKFPFWLPFLRERAAPKKKMELVKKEEKVVILNEELWATQPKTVVKVEVGGSVTLKGKNIKRFLVVSPEFVEVKRTDKNTLKVSGKKKGYTFLHLWDNRGRWTFNIKVIFPVEIVSAKKKLIEEKVKPFRFNYSADWSSYYSGDKMNTMERKSLSFSQRTEIVGDTPYGKADLSANFSKFKKTTEVSGYTAGLTNGKLGPFKGFNLRVFDTTARFSSLSLPGAGIKGVTLESDAFHKNVKYSLLWGRDRLTCGYLAPGVVTKKESFIEGAKITLFPYKDNQYSFNFAHGYGSAREEYLSDTVFSLEAQRKFKNNKIYSEIGFDGENLAGIINSMFKKGKLSLNLNLRDIPKDFTTVTTRAQDRGEIGGIVRVKYELPKWAFSSDLDVYRDRYLFNPEKPDKLNFDWSASLSFSLTPLSFLRTSLGYTHTPQLLSPQKSFRINNNYSTRFTFLKNKFISVFLGNTYQRNRYILSPSSNYDRYGLSGGVGFPLFKSLSYYLNYSYSWVKECLRGGITSPRVLTTGLRYYKRISPFTSTNFRLSYRDEEDAKGEFSFLAGEDSLELSGGLSYKPSSDFEFFVDTRVRDVWAERADRDAYNEADIRMGVISWWNLPFRWGTKGIVRGVVFEDENGNGKKDKGEEGIAGVKIKVGKKEVVTDKNGCYKVTVRATRVVVEIEIASIPPGHTFSTPSSQEVEIIPGKTPTVNFGLTTRSSICGVVFYDKNNNRSPDAGDKFIPGVKLILDNKKVISTDSEGSYFFSNVSPGKHKVRLNINSLPLEYLPLVKIIKEITVEKGTSYTYNIPLKKK